MRVVQPVRRTSSACTWLAAAAAASFGVARPLSTCWIMPGTVMFQICAPCVTSGTFTPIRQHLEHQIVERQVLAESLLRRRGAGASRWTPPTPRRCPAGHSSTAPDRPASAHAAGLFCWSRGYGSSIRPAPPRAAPAPSAASAPPISRSGFSCLHLLRESSDGRCTSPSCRPGTASARSIWLSLSAEGCTLLSTLNIWLYRVSAGHHAVIADADLFPGRMRVQLVEDLRRHRPTPSA